MTIDNEDRDPRMEKLFGLIRKAKIRSAAIATFAFAALFALYAGLFGFDGTFWFLLIAGAGFGSIIWIDVYVTSLAMRRGDYGTNKEDVSEIAEFLAKNAAR